MVPPALTTAPAQASERTEPTVLPHINGTAIGRQWPRDKWLEAMWESETLTANERCVAYVYARYAGKSDVSWCHWDELRKRTGIKSRDAINRAIRGLLTAGWFAISEAARQHYSARYRLTIPSQGSGRRTSRELDAASSSPGNGRLSRAGRVPVVRETDIPVVRETTPVVRETDPSTQTDHSDLQPGGTLPPDPLRPEHPPGTRNDPPTAPDLVVHSNDTKQVTNRPRARAQLPLLAVIPPEPEIGDTEEFEIPDEIPARIRDEVLPALAAQLNRINSTGAAS